MNIKSGIVSDPYLGGEECFYMVRREMAKVR